MKRLSVRPRLPDVDSEISRKLDVYKKGLASKGMTLAAERFTPADAEQEVFADFIGKLVTDADLLRSTARTNPGLIQRIGEFIRTALERLGGTLPDAQARRYAKLAGDIRALAGLQSGETGTVEGSTRWALNENGYPDNADAMYTDPELYSYDFLTKQRPMTVATMPEISEVVGAAGSVDRAAIVRKGKENAALFGEVQPDGTVVVENAYTGREVKVSNKSIDHSLTGNNQVLLRNASIASVIGDVCRNGIPINGLKNKRQATGTYALASLLKNRSGAEFVAIAIIERHDNSVKNVELYDVAHSASGRQKRDGTVGSKPRRLGLSTVLPSTDSKISIAEFLRIVNSTHLSILSDDVLNRLGTTRDAEGEYADKVLFSLDESDDAFIDELMPEPEGEKNGLPHQSEFGYAAAASRPFFAMTQEDGSPELSAPPPGLYSAEEWEAMQNARGDVALLSIM